MVIGVVLEMAAHIEREQLLHGAVNIVGWDIKLRATKIVAVQDRELQKHLRTGVHVQVAVDHLCQRWGDCS